MTTMATKEELAILGRELGNGQLSTLKWTLGLTVPLLVAQLGAIVALFWTGL